MAPLSFSFVAVAMNPLLRSSSKYAYSISFLIVFALFYGVELWDWISFVPGSNEDAFKNYYTLAYHISHDGNPFWFDGMNYPHGEHVVFTDNQPLISGILWFLDVILPIGSWISWILPLLLIASMYLGGWLIQKMLRTEGGSPWVTALLGVGIIFLSPQWQRFSGHYSLAHGVVIPLVIFALWKWNRGEWRLRTTFWIVFLSGFVHPYFAAMCSLFLVAFLLLQEIHRPSSDKPTRWLHTLRGAAPVLVFQVIMWITDPVTDRPQQPFGFLDYRATWRSVLLPLKEIFPSSAEPWFEMAGPQSLEGSNYLGLVGIFLGGALLIQVLRGRSMPQFEHRLLLGGFPLLLLGLAIPFTFWEIPSTIENLIPIKQFRGIARFTWVFFYAANIGGALYLIRKLPSWNNRWIPWALSAIMLLEGAMYSGFIRAVSQGDDDVFRVDQLDAAIDLTEYSAILPLPFFHIGSENFRTPENTNVNAVAFDLSLETGLPMLALQMSRTSLSQTMHHLALVKHIMEPSIFLEGLPEESWVVMVEPTAALTPSQLRIFNNAEHLGTFNGFELYGIHTSLFEDLLEANVQAVDSLLNENEGLNLAPHMTIDSAAFFFDPCEESEGQRGKKIARKDWSPLFPQRACFGDTLLRELTFWVKVDQGAMNMQVWFWERNGDEDIRFGLTEVGDHVFGFLNGWALCKIDLKAEHPSHTFEVMLHRDDENVDLWVDDILIRLPNTHVVKEDTIPNINNRYYELPEGLGVEEG